MSEQETITFYKDLQRKLISKVIVAIIAGLFLMIVGGGWTMAKVFNVKGKADKTYVDGFYGEMTRIMENRTLVLEQMVKALKESNEKDMINLQKQLDDLNTKWQTHMSYHMERTRGAISMNNQ